MENKKLKTFAALLAAAMICLPVNAANVVSSDVFSKNSVKPWETDQKDPPKLSQPYRRRARLHFHFRNRFFAGGRL